MKKILVTGATGFIGQHVIKRLMENGVEVIASSANSDKARLAPWFGRIRYIPFNLEELDPARNYYTFFEKPDQVLHLAWEGLPNYKSSYHIEINYPRHALLLENLVAGGCGDISVTGTCFEYGMQEGALREDLPARPANPYGKAKDELRRFLENLQQEHPYVFRWIRLFYMYGEGQNSNSLLSQLDQALDSHQKAFNMSGGEQVRDYLPVEEAAGYIVAILSQDKVTGIVNCCSGTPVTVRQMVEEHLRKRGKKIHLNTGYYSYPDYEPMRFWGDSSKLKTIITR